MIDGGLCQTCRKQQGYIVHHVILLTPDNIGNPEISLNHKYLRYECKACHDLEEGHGVRKKDLPLLRFDEAGDPIPPPEIFRRWRAAYRQPPSERCAGHFV